MKINHKKTLLFLALVVLFSLSLVRYERFADKRNFGDFRVYDVTGERLRGGEPIYRGESDEITPFKYSALVASFFAVLSVFDKPVSAGIWHLLNLFFLIGSTFLILALIRIDRGERGSEITKKEFLLAWIGILGVSPPILHCLNSGQVGLAILFFYLLGIYFARKEKDITAGFFLALSAMFKYLPILVLPYYLWKGKKRFVLFTVLWLVILHFLPALWLGFERNWNYLHEFAPFLTSTTMDHVSFLDFKNQSLWAYLYRLLYYEFGFFKTEVNIQVFAAIGVLFFLVIYGLILFSGSKKKFFAIDAALFAIVIAIMNPNAWKHNFVLLLFPYLVLLLKFREKNWWKKEFLVLLLATILILSSNREILGWGMRFELMSASVLFLSSMLLFVSLVFSKQSSSTP